MKSIVPIIEVTGGKCRQLNSDDEFGKNIYTEDPVSVARYFLDMGIFRFYMSDLDGALQKTLVNWQTLERLSAIPSAHIILAGGVESTDDVRTALECGADKISAGTIADRRKILVRSWLTKFGAANIIIEAEVTDQSKLPDSDALQFIAGFYQAGVREFICTLSNLDSEHNQSIAKVCQQIKRQFPEIRLIINTRFSKTEDFRRLQISEADSIMIGSALYDGSIDIDDVKEIANCVQTG
ncbi:MAG: HisA/HisF-related TIM barrel protein [Calditrichaceae bacterium]